MRLQRVEATPEDRERMEEAVLYVPQLGSDEVNVDMAVFEGDSGEKFVVGLVNSHCRWVMVVTSCGDASIAARCGFRGDPNVGLIHETRPLAISGFFSLARFPPKLADALGVAGIYEAFPEDDSLPPLTERFLAECPVVTLRNQMCPGRRRNPRL